MSKNIPLQEASLDIWDTKYRLKDEANEPIDKTIDDSYLRVASTIAAVEETPELQEKWEKRFLWASPSMERCKRILYSKIIGNLLVFL